MAAVGDGNLREFLFQRDRGRERVKHGREMGKKGKGAGERARESGLATRDRDHLDLEVGAPWGCTSSGTGLMADDGSEESRVCSAQQEAWWSSRPEGSGAGGARVGWQMIPRWEEAAGFGGWLGEGIEEGHGRALVGGLDWDEIRGR